MDAGGGGGCGGGADLSAYADDDVGVAGAEISDGEVHPPQHAHLHQPDEVVQHGRHNSSSSAVFLVDFSIDRSV
jgi:hypothetical protein